MACAECRRQLTAAADPALAAASWAAIADRIDRPRPRAGRAGAATGSGSAATSPACSAATPALQAAGLVAVVRPRRRRRGAVARRPTPTGPFLVLAPLVPLAAVAASFAPAADPAGEAGVGHPAARRRARRPARHRHPRASASSLARSAALALPDLGPAAAAWVLPALALALGALALGTWLRVEVAVGSLGRGWLLAVWLGVVARRPRRRRRRLRHLRRRRPADRRSPSPSPRPPSSPPGATASQPWRPSDDQRHAHGVGRPGCASGSARPSPSTVSTPPSPPASTGCSARTAPARPRCCASWPPCCPPTTAGSRRSASTRPRPPAASPSAAGSATCPRSPGFHRQFSAFDFVDYVAILKEWADRKPRHDEVRRVLTLVGLDAVMHKRIRQLSGGMRRRVGIAQALLGRPDLLVLDEPTAGLDPEQRLRFRELLGTEAAGATVLLSTHQTDDVAALCQHVVVLLAGQIRFTGTPGDLAALADGPGLARQPTATRAPTWPGSPARAGSATSASRPPAPSSSSPPSRTATSCSPAATPAADGEALAVVTRLAPQLAGRRRVPCSLGALIVGEPTIAVVCGRPAVALICWARHVRRGRSGRTPVVGAAASLPPPPTNSSSSTVVDRPPTVSSPAPSGGSRPASSSSAPGRGSGSASAW